MFDIINLRSKQHHTRKKTAMAKTLGEKKNIMLTKAIGLSKESRKT